MPLDPDFLFAAGNTIVLAGWAMVILLPKRSPALMAVPKFAIPVLFGLVYAGITLARFHTSGGGYGSLAELRTLFATDELLVAGWLHYLAFDLFVGVWIAEQSDETGLSRPIQAVILVTAFIFPPVGLVLFLSTRAAMRATERLAA